MSSRWIAMGAALAAVGVAVACRADNTLIGSADELFPLDVSRVDMIRNTQGFQVSYYANRGADVDIVARLNVYVGDVGIDAGSRLPLQGEYLPGHDRATVMHLTAGEAARYFPPVERGDLFVDRGGNAGEYTHGSFSVLFKSTDGYENAYGAGRTLDGTFAGTPKDGGWDR